MDTAYDVLIIGGGVAGRMAATFTARHGWATLVLDDGGSLLRRNAHLENVPGFPDGVNARRFLDLMGAQAERAGATVEADRVTAVTEREAGFTVETAAEDTHTTRYVIAATKNAVGYLDGVDGVTVIDRGKTFLETDDRGRTGVAGLYAAGRLAGRPHQAIVAAGHGATVAVTLLEDDERPFYHDWVAPEGYFTDRGRDLPPGCEEIDAAESAAREKQSMATMRDRFAAPHPDDQETHPSLAE